MFSEHIWKVFRSTTSSVQFNRLLFWESSILSFSLMFLNSHCLRQNKFSSWERYLLKSYGGIILIKLSTFHVFIYLNFLTFLKFSVLLLRANGGQYINYIQRNDIVFGLRLSIKVCIIQKSIKCIWALNERNEGSECE